MRPIFDMIKGSAEPIVVQLYPVSSDTGSNGVDLTGATEMSAKAQLEGTSTTVSFATATVFGAATEGQVKLTYAANLFSAAGLWDVQITYTDGAGNVRKYPSEGSGLRIRVNEAIT